uniref:Uncharacterized protein n=1 Tax=Amphimedon queenslandica TaxID=400682 RepID=A0A1X7TM34_AMPQE
MGSKLDPPTAHEVSRLLGKLNLVSQAVSPGPLYCRGIQNDLTAALEQSSQCSLPPVPNSQGGPKLVGEPFVSLERGKPGSKATGFPQIIGCIPHRLGSILQRNPDCRPLVSEGETYPHQLPGVASSCPGSEDLLEESGQQASTATAGQPNSSSVHQQPGRDSVGPGSSPSSRPMNVVLGERYSLNSRIFLGMKMFEQTQSRG